MRILIVRHGDPNYELDTLTETGWKEARLVAEYLAKFNIAAFYVSPLGRAQDNFRHTFIGRIHRIRRQFVGTGCRRIWKKITHIMIETTGARRTLCVQKM